MARSATSVVVLGVLVLVGILIVCNRTNDTEDPPRRVVGYAYTDTHFRGERIAIKAPCNCCPFKSSNGKNVGVRSAVMLPRPGR